MLQANSNNAPKHKKKSAKQRERDITNEPKKEKNEWRRDENKKERWRMIKYIVQMTMNCISVMKMVRGMMLDIKHILMIYSIEMYNGGVKKKLYKPTHTPNTQKSTPR
jgi:hypothetical protein